MRNPFLYYSLKYAQIFRRYQSWFMLLFILLGIFVGEVIFRYILEEPAFKPYFQNLYKIGLGGKEIKIIDFAPEAWLSLLGLVLGTLIIVISVASQSTPKLIDLYTNDKISLLYVWLIVIGSAQNMYLQLYSETDAMAYKSSMILNTYFLLPTTLLLGVPYVLYILRYTKTSNVIRKISTNNLSYIYHLKDMAEFKLLNDNKSIAQAQYDLFEPLNQLDNLLEYVAFKEPKGDIINKVGLAIRTFSEVKMHLLKHSPDFFKISNTIGSDVSFKTMTGQFPDMEEHHIFYEQKGFRLLGNAYQQLIENQDFDLASLCAYELSECGRTAISSNDRSLVDSVLVRFNTLIRFGIKHGLKNKEPRNLYNAIFHYSGFILHIIRSKDRLFIEQSCFYLNIYVNEIYRHSREEPSFAFLVDAFTWEFKRLLIELDQNDLDLDIQNKILQYFLKIDNLSDNFEDVSMRGRQFRGGLRTLQISLALYYLRVDQYILAETIVQDIVGDHQYMDRETLRTSLNNVCNGIKQAKPKFWEDTDRGNSNLYYSEDKDQVGKFLEIFESTLTQQQQNKLN